MQQLTLRQRLLVASMLFGMFFGAGNLIFPSFVGAQAGTSTVIAMAGLMISAVGLPILGVVAVAQSGGLKILAGRVHPVFASVFTILIYLAIGPGLAIPRTASTSYEMAAAPLIGAASPTWTRVGYSLVFFGVALLLSLRPEKLTDRLGKITGPCLLVLIGAMTVACLFFAPDSFAPAGFRKCQMQTVRINIVPVNAGDDVGKWVIIAMQHHFGLSGCARSKIHQHSVCRCNRNALYCIGLLFDFFVKIDIVIKMPHCGELNDFNTQFLLCFIDIRMDITLTGAYNCLDRSRFKTIDNILGSEQIRRRNSDRAKLVQAENCEPELIVTF